MSVISNECVVFSIGENINPNDEIFNFANFIRILDDLYKEEEEVALVKFIEKVNIQFELPELEEKVGEDLNEKIKKFFDIIFKKKNKKFKKVDYDEGIIKLLEETFNNSVNLNDLIQSKIFPESNRMSPNEKRNGYNSGLGNNLNMNEENNITTPVARGYRNLKKSKKGKKSKKPKKTKKKGGAPGDENHIANAINYVQLGMLGITLLYGIYTAVRNKVCQDEPFDYYTDEESTDEEDLTTPAYAPIFKSKIGSISKQEVIASKPRIPELGKIILSKDFRRTVSLVVLDPRNGIISGNIEKCVVKYTTNSSYSNLYQHEANVYDKLETTPNEYVISKHNSGKAVNNNGKAVFSLNNSKFSLNLPHRATNYYLILEYDKNYITLEKYGDLLKKKRLNITEKLEEVLLVTYRVLVYLQDKYNFFHTDLKYDNIMVVIDKDEDFNGVKFFDFDLSSIEKDEPIECYRYPGWQDLSHTKLVGFEEPVNKAYFILLDMWRLWLSLRETVDVVSKQREKELLIYKYRDDKGQNYCYLKYPNFQGTSKHKLKYPIKGEKDLNFTFKSFDDLYKEEVINKFEGLYINSNRQWNKYWMSLEFIQKLYKRCIKPSFVKRGSMSLSKFLIRKSKKKTIFKKISL